jgi:hypothetical protein
MDQTVLRPAEGVEERQTQLEVMPWLERARLGRVKAWFMMIGRAMTAPHRLMRALPRESALGQAWWYAAVTWVLILLSGFTLPIGFIGLITLIAGDPNGIVPMGIGAGFAVGGAATAMMAIAVWGASIHGLLRITGGCKLPLSRTLETMCYSTGAAAIIGIPCVGPYPCFMIATVWWIISAILMIGARQEVHGGRATFAVLALPTLLAVLLFSGYFSLLIILIPRTVGSTMVATTSGSEATPLLESVIGYAGDHGGRGPAHAIELSSDSGFMVSSFVLLSSDTLPTDVPVGDVRLDEFMEMSVRDRKAQIEHAIGDLPERVIAHRLGDYVFTYHGIDLSDADPGLWILVGSPDPAAGAGSEPLMVPIGLADGTVQTIEADGLAEALATQNDLRAKAGLPPLPDPDTVLHDAPARAP